MMYEVEFLDGVKRYFKVSCTLHELSNEVEMHGKIRAFQAVLAKPVRVPRVFTVNEVLFDKSDF